MRKLLSLLAILTGLLLGLILAERWFRATRPEYRLARGEELIRDGEYDEAKQIASQLAADGYLDHAHLLRGEVYFTLASPGSDPGHLSQGALSLCVEALREFNQVKDKGDLRLQAAAKSGQCLVFLKQYLEAERALQFVLSEQPDHVDAHRGLAVVYYDLGALQHAGTHLEEVARLAPDDGRPHRLLGLIQKDLEHPDLAVEHYREALRRKLSDTATQDVRVELAEVLVRLSRYTEALEYIEGNKPSPGDVGKAIALRAECFWGLGRTTEARDLLDEAMKLGLKAPEILRLRAKLHQDAGEGNQAVGLLEEVLARDRHDHTSRYQLALVLEGLGRKKEAAEQRALGEKTKELLTEMTQLTEQAMARPQDAGLRRRLAEVCDKLEKPELAAMWRSAADALSPLQK